MSAWSGCTGTTDPAFGLGPAPRPHDPYAMTDRDRRAPQALVVPPRAAEATRETA